MCETLVVLGKAHQGWQCTMHGLQLMRKEFNLFIQKKSNYIKGLNPLNSY